MMRVIHGLAAFAAASLLMFANAVAEPEISDLLFTNVDVVSMSPSGRYLAVAQNAPRTTRQMRKQQSDSTLRVFDLKGSSQQVAVPLGDVRVSWIEWASEDYFVARFNTDRALKFDGRTVSRDFTENKTYLINRSDMSTFEIFKGNRGEVEVFRDYFVDLGASASIIDKLPGDPEHMIMSANLKPSGSGIYKVNITNGDYEILYKGRQNETYLLNSDYKPAFKTSTFGRGGSVRRWYGSPDEGESWYLITEYVVNQSGNQPPPFLPAANVPGDKNKWYVIAPRRNDGPTGVYRYDVVTKKYDEVIFEHPEADIFSFSIGNDGTRRDRVVVNDRKFMTQYFDGKYQSYQAGLEQYFGPDQRVRILQWSADEQTVLLYVSGPSNPGEYYMFTVGKPIQKLFRSHIKVDPAELGEMEVMEATMSDGRNIYSYVTHPVGGKNKKAPLIVLPHGGPQARDNFDWSFIAEAQVFASRGYRVIQTQFRGGGGYGWAFAKEGHGEWGDRIQKDIFESAQVLVDKGLAEKKNIGVWGWSHGGYVAGASTFLNTDMISCAVAGAGVHDLAEMVDRERRTFGNTSVSYYYWRDAIGDPTEVRAKLDAASVEKNIDKVTVPLMLLHGDSDFIVPVEQSRDLRAAMKSGGKGNLLSYKEYREEPHTPTLLNWVDIWERSLDFFGECLEK